MNRVVAVLLLCCSAAAASAQGPVPTTMTSQLRNHVRDERFQIVTAMRGLPLGVREELQRMFGSSAAAIADPGTEFQATDDISKPGLPIRRLVAAGCAQDHCLVYYERGGYAHTWLVALFHWTPTATRIEFGGTASGTLKTIDDVKTAVLAGGVKGPVRGW